MDLQKGRLFSVGEGSHWCHTPRKVCLVNGRGPVERQHRTEAKIYLLTARGEMEGYSKTPTCHLSGKLNKCKYSEASIPQGKLMYVAYTGATVAPFKKQRN